MRLVLCLLLTLAAAPAWAEYGQWGEIPGKATFYIDPNTASRDGNLRRIWSIADMKKRVEGVLSSQSLYEFDCKEKRYRTLSFSMHSGHMAHGEIISKNNRPSEWEYIPPGNFLAETLRLVCSK